MVLGRIFVWSASIAGGLLFATIVALVWAQVERQNQTTSSRQDASAGQDDRSTFSTYHPTEAWVVRPHKQDCFQRTVVFTGKLVAKRRTTLAFESMGRVDQMLVDTADTVSEGQTLASLDTKTLHLELQRAEAQATGARALLNEMTAGVRPTTLQAARAEVDAIAAELVNLDRQLSRQQQLAASGAIAASELDSIQSLVNATTKRRDAAQKRLDELELGTRQEQLQAQEANLDALQSQVELLKVQIEKSELKAPFSGVILETLVDEGAVVSPAQPVIQLLNTDQLEAHVGVPQSVAEAIVAKPNETHLRLKVGNQWLETQLQRTLPVVDPITQTVLLVFPVSANVVQNQPLLNTLLSGATVQLEWEQSVSTSGYWVSNDALTQAERGLWSVYAFEANSLPEPAGNAAAESVIPAADSQQPATIGVAAKIQVEVLYTENNRSYVRGALQPGQWIIAEGTHRLLDGQRVQVKAAPSKQASGSSANSEAGE